MNDLMKKYIENLSAVSESTSVHITRDMRIPDAIAIIHAGAERTYALHSENDSILKQILFDRKPEELTDSDIAELIEFGEALVGPDYPISYLVNRLLHDCAVLRKDDRLIIRSAYNMGIAMFYMRLRREDRDIDLFGDKVAEYFAEAASYYDRYDEFKDPETRSFIVRSIANRRLTPEYYYTGEGKYGEYEKFLTYKRLSDEALAIFNDEKKRAENPELPWDRFVYLFTQSMTTLVSSLRSNGMSEEKYEEVAKTALAASIFVYDVEFKAFLKNAGRISPLTRYRCGAAMYHSGMIGANDFVSILIMLYKEADPNDFTSGGIFRNIRVPLYMQYYGNLMDEAGHKLYDGVIGKAASEVSAYLSSMPRNQYAAEMSLNLSEMIWYQANKGTTYRRQILEYILACHPPTYIHSHMVGRLAERMFLRLAETSPGELVGSFGVTDVGEIVRRREELGIVVRACGLYHDIGKCMIINHVGNYSRRLTDEEFAAIKVHPQLGYAILDSLGNYNDHAQAALHHHRSYDGKGGYPRDVGEVPERMRAVVDIITVADSLEAGTDNVGRCYAATKSVDTLIQELKAGSGTRYAPYVVKLFEDENFCGIMRDEIAAKRTETYYNVYTKMSKN